jgi:hypothetical protein
MATFSWAVKRFRVFLGMGEPPLKIEANSSSPFFQVRLKQNRDVITGKGPERRANKVASVSATRCTILSSGDDTCN